MRQDKFSKTNLILYACGIIPVVWLGLLIAPYINGGLVEIIKNLSVAFSNPNDGMDYFRRLYIFPTTEITEDEKNTALLNGGNLKR